MPGDTERQHVIVPHPDDLFPPASGCVAEADVERYLEAKGWKRVGDCFLRARPDVEEVIVATPRVPLEAFIAHTSIAECLPPKAVIAAVNAKADAEPRTEREPRPLFRTLRVYIPVEADIAPFVAAVAEISGYRIVGCERADNEAVVTLRRIDPGEG
jgi:hypothetical protein